MGAWSHQPFGNDDAIDWAHRLEGTQDLSLIEETLDRALREDDYLEALEASEAVAAIEVLAKLLGKGTQADSHTEKLDRWVGSIAVKPGPVLLDKARRTLERILGENSELCELWEEGDPSEWQSSIDALQKAIGAGQD